MIMDKSQYAYFLFFLSLFPFGEIEKKRYDSNIIKQKVADCVLIIFKLIELLSFVRIQKYIAI